MCITCEISVLYVNNESVNYLYVKDVVHVHVELTVIGNPFLGCGCPTDKQDTLAYRANQGEFTPLLRHGIPGVRNGIG